MIEDFSPIYVGDTGAPFNPVFQHLDGSPVPLQGATITMKMVNEDTNVTQICTGLWTITDPVNGFASYQYQASDVALPGLWALYIAITVNGKPVHADVKILQILPAP